MSCGRNHLAFLGKFGAKTKHDLDMIRLLRNHFAHCRKPLRFSTPVVSDVCKHLLLPDIAEVNPPPMTLHKISENHDATTDIKSPKTLHITCCHSISVHL